MMLTYKLIMVCLCVSADAVRLINVACFRSGLEQDDIRVLYNYLTTSLFPACIELACPSR